ncbi:MAG TPA: hypothetical protein VJ323_02105 [Bryobacteraceae bacterium]|jgi:hypothetical protein|nr:hypothetical protein [Bryobacteraceae bacterium]
MRSEMALLALALAGCATGKAITLPDGRQGYSIRCDGSALSWEQCYVKASEMCQAKGYDIVAKDGDSSPVITGNQYGVYGGAVVHRSLMIACKQ